MKYFLSELIPRLKKYSATLDQSAYLVDKPWVVADNNGGYEKLIFRKDGRVHLSSNGNVKDGNWEYLPEAQSLLIDYGDKKKLYRHQYLDEAVLALKLDGATEGYYLLANENAIPDTDAISYLRKKYLKENNIEIALLDDGREVEMHKKPYLETIIHSKVKIGEEYLADGQYWLHDKTGKIIVKNNKVTDKIKKVDYPNDISVWQSERLPREGEKVDGLKEGSFKVDSAPAYTFYVEKNEITKVVDREARILGIVGLIVLLILIVFSLVVLYS